MTREEYLRERQRLMNEMKDALDQGDALTAEAKGKEVEALDSKFEQQAAAQASYNALIDRQPVDFVAAAGIQQPMQMQPQEHTQARVVDPYDTEEYRNQFMNYVLGRGPKPNVITNAATNGPTTTSDASAVIPTTMLREIVKELKERGVIFSQIRQLNVQGGVEIPILTLKPEAAWQGETSSQTGQKVQANSKITFSYYTLECKISQTLLEATVTFAEFQAMLIPLAVEAVITKIEQGTFAADGSGKMTGIINTSGVPYAEMTATQIADYKEWKKVYSKVPKSYRARGRWYMAQPTFDVYIDGMVDDNGQPIGRVNYGIADEPVQRFAGKNVETTEEDVLPSFDDATNGTVFAVFGDLQNYGFNSNMVMTAVEWIDHDTNKKYTKVMLIADGKVIDKNAFLLVKKKVVSQ